jgi:hypothetical protein
MVLAKYQPGYLAEQAFVAFEVRPEDFRDCKNKLPVGQIQE